MAFLVEEISGLVHSNKIFEDQIVESITNILNKHQKPKKKKKTFLLLTNWRLKLLVLMQSFLQLLTKQTCYTIRLHKHCLSQFDKTSWPISNHGLASENATILYLWKSQTSMQRFYQRFLSFHEQFFGRFYIIPKFTTPEWCNFTWQP